MADLNLRVSADPSTLKKDIQEMTNATEKGAGQMGKSVDDFSFKQAALNKQFDLAVQKAATLAARHGETSKEALKAAAAAEHLALKLNTAQQATATASSAAAHSQVRFNGMQNSINQITREMPAFTYSVQTGFMAISNNLPIFFDQIAAMKAANKELAASGQATKSIASQVASSIFSWGTALSVGITLLTVFGKEIIAAITPADKLKDSITQLAEATTYANKVFDLEERRLKAIGVAEEVIIARRRDRIKQNIQLAQSELKMQEQELLNKNVRKDYFAAAGASIGLPVLQLFAPSNASIKEEEDKLKEIKLKRSEFVVQLAEINKDEKDLAAKREQERKKEIEARNRELSKQFNSDLAAEKWVNSELAKIRKKGTDLTGITIGNRPEITAPTRLNLQMDIGQATQTGKSQIAIMYEEFKMGIMAGNQSLEQMMQGMGQSLKNATNAAFAGLGNAIGTEIANGFNGKGFDDFGKMLGNTLASLANQIGTALIAFGVPLMSNPLTFAQGALNVGTGTAMIAAGSFIAAKLGGSSSGGGSTSAGGSSGGPSTGWSGTGGINTGFGGMSMQLSGGAKITGRDLQLVYGREGYFSRRVTGK